jgi:hypothetical protein
LIGYLWGLFERLIAKGFNHSWCELSFPRRRESIAPFYILAISHRLKDAPSLPAANGSAAIFSDRPDLLARRLPCFARNDSRAFRIARRAKHKKARWIPACAGMTVHTGNDNLRWQGKKHFSNIL